MTDLSPFYAKRFHPQNYNCGHFVFEVYLKLTGKNLQGITSSLMVKDYSRFKTEKKKLTKIETPDKLCVAVTSRKSNELHAGVYMDGKILHLTEKGVFLDDPAAFGKNGTLRYYR